MAFLLTSGTLSLVGLLDLRNKTMSTIDQQTQQDFAIGQVFSVRGYNYPMIVTAIEGPKANQNLTLMPAVKTDRGWQSHSSFSYGVMACEFVAQITGRIAQ